MTRMSGFRGSTLSSALKLATDDVFAPRPDFETGLALVLRLPSRKTAAATASSRADAMARTVGKGSAAREVML